MYLGEILPLPFLRYRFCELKYRGAVGRRQVHCTLIVKIIRFYYLDFAKIESKSCLLILLNPKPSCFGI